VEVDVGASRPAREPHTSKQAYVNPPPSPWEGAVPSPLGIQYCRGGQSHTHGGTEARDRVSRKYLCGEDPHPLMQHAGPSLPSSALPPQARKRSGGC